MTDLVALSPDGLARENMLMRTVCAQAVGLAPLPFEAVTPSSQADPVLAEFAEQFSVDVAGVSVEQRAAFMAAHGAEVLGVAALMYGQSEQLTPAHKAALRYVDALIWTPSSVDEAAAVVLEHFSAEQALEITLDVMRNGTNKIAVALGGDAPRVADGVEHYLLGADGQPVFS
ncbi:MAG: hypothetical protein U5N53_18385 [Mycobacterium sp.]|nr:hypothetical protein [Mycobacterium sp.]